MGIFEILLTAIGLAMDAFAVSICKGLNTKGVRYRNIFIIALFFGGFQALMPFIGWIVGKQFEQYIVKYDHWITFILLALIGGNMLWEALTGKEEESCNTLMAINYKELFLLAIATSIDALAVGVTFAFLKVNIVFAISAIGIITFIIAAFGVLIGIRFGVKYKKKAEIAGGVILILIGLKILLEHLEVL
jgi:putative Mn2+ efflux pump MntP